MTTSRCAHFVLGSGRLRLRPSFHASMPFCRHMASDHTQTPLQTLQDAPPEAKHGTLVRSDWANPVVSSHYDTKARHTFTDISANEYTDQAETLREKVALLASLLRRADNTIAYTGAGISTAAGIDCFATHAKEAPAGEPEIKDWKQARPTTSHYAMAALHRAGLLKHWVQQNHDSLPQKAGYPQYALNEIHGSLHDPSNPIVPYEGTLRDDLYQVCLLQP